MKIFFNIIFNIILFNSYLKISKCEYINVFYDKKLNIIEFNNKKFQLFPINNNNFLYKNNTKNDIIIKLNNSKVNNKFFNTENYKSNKFNFYLNIIAVIILTIFAGLMSGLTVGFMGLDPIILEIQEKNGTQKQKKYLKRILYMLSKHHWLLVTLLLCNSFAAETMPIVLHKIISEVPAIIISVILLLFFGEIIPMALCTGPNQMKLVICLYPLIYFLMIITYIISYPIALLMDKIIGKQEKVRFNNDELKELIKLHDKSLINKNNLNNKNIGLNSIQIKIIQNIIDLEDLEEKQIKNIMKNYDSIKKYEKNEQLSINKIKNIKKDKKDFVPIYENNINNIIGVLNINELIDLENKTNFNELYINEPIFFNINNINILNILEKLIKKKQRISFILKEVTSNSYKNNLENGQQTLIDNSIFSKNDDLNSEINEKIIENNKEKILGVIYLDDILNNYIFNNLIEIENNEFNNEINVKIDETRKIK